MFEGLILGIQTALVPTNLLGCFIGCLVGTLVGILPGVGVSGTMALLLPLTFALGPTGGMIMLAGIWYGANYGGSTTSILVNVPGEATSVVTCLDGHKMALKGRAGAALSIAAIGSFVAGTFSVVGLNFFAPPLAEVALAFGPPEYFSLALMGLVVLSNLSGSSTLKSFIMAFLGVGLATIGMDNISGSPRFTMGFSSLFGGIEFVPLLMGVFGIAEVIRAFCQPPKGVSALIRFRFQDLYPNREEMRRSIKPIIRGSFLGFFVGLIPGPAAVMASFASYGLERRVVNPPEGFGNGAVEGLAGPESANNSACGGGMVPLLALGLPFSPPTAVLISGLILHNITPGPLLMQQRPDLFWGIIGSMYVGNLILLIMNLPLVGIFASISRVRPAILMPLVLILCMVGAYAVNNSFFDIWVMVIAGVLGFLMERHGYEPAPLVLGLVLGNMMESSLRRSMVIFEGDWLGFFHRPISGAVLVLTLLVIILPLILRSVGQAREKIREGA
jgi:putative tricarboxylic transport membrane protein